MKVVSELLRKDNVIFIAILFLALLSVSILRSISPEIFPQYFLFLLLGFLVFIIFLQIDFETYTAFSKPLYIGSILFLLMPLLIGQVTRGAIRWIPLGPITIQPSEIVRPFLLIFFAQYLITNKVNLANLFKFIFLVSLPVFLILIQPSLGVAILTLVGIVGVITASSIDKKPFLILGVILFLLTPVFWKAIAPYQRQRLTSFISPQADPLGAGYNSIQSMIAVGSGKIFGRGLGEGVQTQLAFLPEKHTDFVFAATSEELGFAGGTLLLSGLLVLFIRLINIIENAKNPVARAYVTGLFFTLFAETLIHIGMNLGILPITGVPLPLVSAGGSAFLATLIGLAIAIQSRKRR